MLGRQRRPGLELVWLRGMQVSPMSRGPAVLLHSHEKYLWPGNTAGPQSPSSVDKKLPKSFSLPYPELPLVLCQIRAPCLHCELTRC